MPTSYPILHKVYRHEHANATTDEKVVLKSGQDEDCEHGQHRWEPLLQVAMEVGFDPLVGDRVPRAKVLIEIAAVPPILEGVTHTHTLTHRQTLTHTHTHTLTLTHTNTHTHSLATRHTDLTQRTVPDRTLGLRTQ